MTAPSRVEPWEIYPQDHLAPSTSLAFVVGYGCLLALFTLVLVYRSLMRVRLARAAEASFDATRALEEGPTVIAGVVEYAEGERTAVRVEVEQKGTEAEQSGTWTHYWTETSRKTIVRPFYLRLPNAQRVLVTPPADVDVADALDGKVLVETTRRIRFAELTAGEQIFARGALHRAFDPESSPSTAGYREQAKGWRLDPDGGKMLLSSEPLGAGLRARALFHRRALWGVVVMAVAACGLVYTFQERLRRGELEVATVQQLVHSTEESDDGVSHYYECHALLPTKTVLVENLDEDDWNRLAKGERVMLLVAPHSWQMGARATLHAFAAVLISIATAIGLIVYGWMRSSSRPWYRRKVVEAYGGRLPAE